MKKLLLLMLFVMSFANAQVGIGTPTPASTLDITAANPSGAATTVDGILIPRIDRQRAQGMLLTPTSTLIYVNSIATGAAAGTAVNITSVGFYFFDGTVWQKIQAGAASSDWTILGNTGTVAATNFVGTTDAIDFVTRTNNTEKMRVTSAGNVGIGTTTPSRLLNINSSATTVESSATFTKANALGLVMGMSANPDPFTGGGSALNGKSFIHSNAGVDMQIATTSANNLEFGTNGINRMFINSNGAVGIGTTTPNGALDVNGANNYGFIAPRIALTATNVALPVINPQGGAIIAGTVIYNTATVAAGANSVAPGLYFWDGAKWVAFAGSPGGLDWTLTGNSFTTPGTFALPGVNYIGTSDAQALHIATNGLPRIRVTTNGNVGVGSSSLATTLLNVGNTSATNTTSLIVTNTLATGTGAIISGQNRPASSFANSAACFNGLDYGATGVCATVATGVGVAGVGQGGTSISSFAGFGSGVSATGTNLALSAFTSNTAGVRNAARFDALNATATLADDPSASLAGFATAVDVGGGAVNIRDVSYGGYFSSGFPAASFAYVGANLSANVGGSTNYKIIGTGTVSTIVASAKANDSKKIMFAPEAPEVLFEDYGTAQLVNGTATVNVDPTFARNIFVDDKHPLKVFIQLEGDCKGVFVTNKSKNSFTVKELASGNSSVAFSWHIIGNRIDETATNGEKIIYQSLRYPDAPGPLASPEHKVTQVKKANTEVDGNQQHTASNIPN